MRVFAEHGPPLFVSLAAYLGWKPQRRGRAKERAAADVAQLLAMGRRDESQVDPQAEWLKA
jgi:hypothetical protein